MAQGSWQGEPQVSGRCRCAVMQGHPGGHDHGDGCLTATERVRGSWDSVDQAPRPGWQPRSAAAPTASRLWRPGAKGAAGQELGGGGGGGLGTGRGRGGAGRPGRGAWAVATEGGSIPGGRPAPRHVWRFLRDPTWRFLPARGPYKALPSRAPGRRPAGCCGREPAAGDPPPRRGRPAALGTRGPGAPAPALLPLLLGIARWPRVPPAPCCASVLPAFPQTGSSPGVPVHADLAQLLLTPYATRRLAGRTVFPPPPAGLPCADHSVRVLRLRCRLTHLCIPVPRSEPASPHRPSLQRLQGLKPGPATWLPCSVPRDEQRSERERPDFSGAYPAAALETRSSALPEATAIRVQSFRWTSLNCSASVRQGKQSSELETKSGICQDKPSLARGSNHLHGATSDLAKKDN
ncbi:uncharacterized protein [Manis javanica]|uniref:uncharacterized protein n=1 Tax=Manis javanica TaxID=9974 RepID=UPI003C6CE5E1